MAADRSLAGVLPRTASARQIAAAVAALSEGLVVRPAVPAQALVGPAPVLTPREGEILAQIGEGMSNKAIARRLGISAHTVKYHLEAVFAKLAVRSRAEAVSQGVRRGLVHL
jgi:two-component system, NarL family, nitrate/nitrite response regulator NarL